MYRPKKYRYKTKQIGLLMLILGITIVAILILPFTVWMVLLGICLMIIGYKLFK